MTVQYNALIADLEGRLLQDQWISASHNHPLVRVHRHAHLQAAVHGLSAADQVLIPLRSLWW